MSAKSSPGDHEQRQAWEMKGDKLGRQGSSGSEDESRMEIMKGHKLGRQGGSGSQEQSRLGRQPRAVQKRDELGRQGGGSQEQSRIEIMKGDKGDKYHDHLRRQRHHDHLGISGISNPAIEK